MIKHHRYGTGYLIEGTTPNVVLDIGKPIPSGWRNIGGLPVPKFAGRYELNYLSKLILEALEALELPIYIQGAPDKDTSAILKPKILHPSTFLEFKEAVADATKEGHLPRDFKVFLSGPSDLDVVALIDFTYEKLIELGEKKKTPQQVEQEVKAFALKLANNKIISTVHVSIAPKEDPRHTTSTGFSLGIRGWNVMGHAKESPAAIVPAEILRALNRAMNNIKVHRHVITESLLGLYYHTLWQRFNTVVHKEHSSMTDVLTQKLNSDDVRKKYAAAHTPAEPAATFTYPKDNTSREPGPNPVLGYTRSITREKVGGASPVSASIRSNAKDTPGGIVSANTADRKWMNAHGVMVKADAIPEQLGDWIPVDRVKPLVSTPDFDVFFAIYYDHPLLRPSSSGQPYWYGSKSHFIAAAEKYGELTGDRPALLYRVFRKNPPKAGIAISPKEFDAEASAKDRGQVSQTITAFHNAVESGIRGWKDSVHRHLGSHVDLEQQDIPDNPIKKHPPQVREKDWLAYVNWIRSEGEKVLGLKFKSGRKDYRAQDSNQQFKYQRSSSIIQARQKVIRDMEFTGTRGKDGKPEEPFAVYFIEILKGHATHGTLSSTYAIPINIIRGDEDLPPRRTVGKFTKSDFMEIIESQFAQRGVSKVDWEFIEGNARRLFPYAFITRLSIASPEEQAKLNNIFKHGTDPKIERTQAGYKINGIHWEAHQMITAMPPRIAEQTFGLLARNSYHFLLKDDPSVLYKIKRSVGGKSFRIDEFGLSPIRTRSEFFADPSQRSTSADVDPNFGRTSSKLTDEYFKSRIGQRWEPIIKARVTESGHFAEAYIAGYQRANSYEDKKDIWDQYLAKAKEKSGTGEHGGQLETDVQMALTSAIRAESSNFDPTVGRSVTLYLQYASRTLETPGGSIEIKVPQLVENLGLAEYAAPMVSIDGHNLEYKVKAPSKDIARALITLKLLRRSTRNKTLGALLKVKTRSNPKDPRGIGLVADAHAFLLAQWSAAGFPCEENNDPKGLTFEKPRTRLTPSDPRMIRARHLGGMRTINMLKVG